MNQRGLKNWVAGNDGAIKCANRNTGDHIRANAGLFQRFHRTTLESTKSTAALQNVDRLVRDMTQLVVWI